MGLLVREVFEVNISNFAKLPTHVNNSNKIHNKAVTEAEMKYGCLRSKLPPITSNYLHLKMDVMGKLPDTDKRIKRSVGQYAYAQQIG